MRYNLIHVPFRLMGHNGYRLANDYGTICIIGSAITAFLNLPFFHRDVQHKTSASASRTESSPALFIVIWAGAERDMQCLLINYHGFL